MYVIISIVIINLILIFFIWNYFRVKKYRQNQKKSHLYARFIAITGFKGSGKDTLGDYLCKTRGYKKMSLATPLKVACSAIFHFNVNQLYDESLKEHLDSRWGFTPRFALQKVGTELFRDTLPNVLPHIEKGEIWKKSLKLSLSKLKSDEKIVITDLRFPDEATFLREMGFYIIKVVRQGQFNFAMHSSETEINSIQPSITLINNGRDLNDFYQHIDHTLENIIGPKSFYYMEKIWRKLDLMMKIFKIIYYVKEEYLLFYEAIFNLN